MAAASLALFGQSGALFLLEQYGGKATSQELIEFLDKNYHGAMTPEMVRACENFAVMALSIVSSLQRNKGMLSGPSLYRVIMP